MSIFWLIVMLAHNQFGVIAEYSNESACASAAKILKADPEITKPVACLHVKVDAI